jgi:hypothetical protein
VISKGKLTDEAALLRADEEYESMLAPADTPVDKGGKIVASACWCA